MGNKVRLAVVGGQRGGAFGSALVSLADTVELAAVCDLNPLVLVDWQSKYPGIAVFDSFDKLLDSPTVDAVFLATPMLIHARQAVQALRAGKHVLSEVIAAHTIEDGWELVEAVEQTGLTYMMAENYLFTRENMMVQQLARAGKFGEITYAECGYIHDCRNLFHHEDGSLTWRGEYIRDFNGAPYPTHSLGPVAKWLGIGDEGGDTFEELFTMNANNRASVAYFRERFGAEHPGAQPGFWRQGDTSSTLIRTKRGALISLRVDLQSSRPHNMVHYGLQGTKGAYMGPRFDGETPLIWQETEIAGEKGHEEWQPLWSCASKWEHPLWREWSAEALATGHGGGDLFVLQEFVTAVRERRRPLVDVYDAVTWSSVFPLSVQSTAAGGAPVRFVDYRQGK
ncbi:Gfo/Idh/MocA family protein [Cohnella phaseoli]|uniref:Putative dehydrogenase n=1 Tax=Cohnella phaseoli TaxID=456490 RepID=A0A3D9IUY3_9BACL|nr:Gfo/Idh/MocA family oxidoreductase [Cohnella phaseoli]RED65495.1 putative dehydrogenase [Cohnella phaseoli]